MSDRTLIIVLTLAIALIAWAALELLHSIVTAAGHEIGLALLSKVA